ncbi:Mitochondrial substrate/solute carrier repeat and Mitochondrial carrier domain-containing protein [Strongyloides ratti]|uniref:Mitochondrial substrate/solute carrier repeat and Mitochondrial carrier domain-containing protein n=1 Tax=Strongyloides ratti TaxID=34506 RepID=A0A090L096_STRRB|nr:Mitochondrial substrate/solute carrier repeat and Mitochondrial carrier domain-containing protein [Strongyloides ratti]CEF60919.1 Mitochondrial substrate/solute carrier repeat and Mitochondrial carrier domain-containing protein [Strongyloides ratti]
MLDDFIAGWISGGIGLVVGHPFDTIKTRVQTIKQFNGPYHCLLITVKNESLKGLYKGMLGPSVTIGFQNSLLFSGYGWTLKIINNDYDKNNLPMSNIIFASIIGTWLQLIPAIPIDNLKTKLQIQRNLNNNKEYYKGPIDGFIKIFKKKGLFGLYEGGCAMFWRDNIGYLFYIPVYEKLKRYLIDKKYNENLSQLIGGGLAGSISWLSICPIEVVKNKLQVMEQLDKKNIKKMNYKLIYKKIINEDGIKGFYKGGLILVCRGFLTNAVVFFVYENIMGIWGELFKSTNH